MNYQLGIGVPAPYPYLTEDSKNRECSPRHLYCSTGDTVIKTDGASFHFSIRGKSHELRHG